MSVLKPKIAYTREEAAEATGMSVYKVRAAINDSILPAKKLGRDIVILHDDLTAWVNSWEVA